MAGADPEQCVPKAAERMASQTPLATPPLERETNHQPTETMNESENATAKGRPAAAGSTAPPDLLTAEVNEIRVCVEAFMRLDPGGRGRALRYLESYFTNPPPRPQAR